MSKHTAGPWEWVTDNELKSDNFEVVLEAGDDGRPLGQHYGIIEHHYDHDAKEANKRLISAAPCLLAAHEPDREGADFLDWVADRLVFKYGENPNQDFIICLRRRAEKARAAIAKATGGN